MRCQFTTHKFQEILLFCLNNNCKKAQACQECIQTFHIQHINDCFKLDEMEFILSNELEKIVQLSNQETQSFKIFAEQHIQIIKQAIESIKNNAQKKINKNEIDNIISITKQCYHRQIQHQILTFILQNFRNKSEIKSNLINKFQQTYSGNTLEYLLKRLVQQGYRLFELKKYYESYSFFDQAYRLGYFEVNFIKIYCLVLFLTNKKDKAQELQLNNNEIFQNNQDFNLQLGSCLFLEKTDEYKQFNYFLRINSFDQQAEQAHLLLKFNQFDKSLEIVDQILKKDPRNQRAIEIKVEALLTQGKFGLAKEFINAGEKLYPSEFQIAKLICLVYDRKFFDDYNQQMFGEDQLQHIQQYTHFVLSNEEMELKNLEKLEQYIQNNKLEYQRHGVLWKYFSEIKKRLLNGSNTKHPKFVKIFQKFFNQEYDKALTLVDELIIIVPTCRFLYFIKSRCFQQQLNFPSCLEFAKIAMYLGKEVSIYTRNYVISLLYNQQFQEAFKILNESTLKNEYHILKLKGQIFYQTKIFTAALKCFEQMSYQEPNNRQPKIMIDLTQAKINQNSNTETQLMMQDKYQNMKNPENLMTLQLDMPFDQLAQQIIMKDFILFYLD